MATAPTDLGKPADQDPPATPSARRMAAERGIALQALTGTGPGGKITKQDVEDAGQSGVSPPSAVAEGSPVKTGDKGGDIMSASPLARRMAEQRGIDLASVIGSGPKGKIIKADIENYDPARVQLQPQKAPPADTGAQTDHANSGHGLQPPHETQTLSNVRKTIARRLTDAKRTIPHIYLTLDIRLDPLLELRTSLNSSLESQDLKLSVNDLLIKALALALKQVPSCNVSYQEERIIAYARQDISVAVAAPSGLITPIIRDAGAKSLSAISREMKMLAAKARDGKLQPHEFQGGTASLSNLGMFGIKQFDAVINPPQAMILAVGAGEKRAHVVGEAIELATVMSATGSFDHRAIDGADGAKFLSVLRGLIEQPLALLA